MPPRRVAKLLAAPFVVPTVAPWSPLPPPRLPATVVRVVDGNTLVVRLDGRDETVRLIGVDTHDWHRARRAGAVAKWQRSSRGGSVILTAESWASTGGSPVLLHPRQEGTSTEGRHGSPLPSRQSADYL